MCYSCLPHRQWLYDKWQTHHKPRIYKLCTAVNMHIQSWHDNISLRNIYFHCISWLKGIDKAQGTNSYNAQLQVCYVKESNKNTCTPRCQIYNGTTFCMFHVPCQLTTNVIYTSELKYMHLPQGKFGLSWQYCFNPRRALGQISGHIFVYFTSLFSVLTPNIFLTQQLDTDKCRVRFH